ncbi:unnamed protein product [Phytophthora fragariaefolia]|uniref:Unnamed protein product n=1 Tax=Phytophthora fragariaefolia TaxID=1490495 RepID=A0A9W6XQ20_9STRA|nr:unnamed protein product [Phytophthora fragariaefolia]
MSTKSIPANQLVLGRDCAHSKCPWYDGVQMTLVGQDVNRETTIIAFALVPAEDIQNYEWFFRQLMNAGLKFTFHVIFCDRDKALISVADALNLNIRYCTLHIIRNVTDKFKIFTKAHQNMVWHLQAAPTKETYLSQLGCIKIALGQDVREYLETIPPVKWCVYANIGVQPLYGWRTSNFVESIWIATSHGAENATAVTVYPSCLRANSRSHVPASPKQRQVAAEIHDSYSKEYDPVRVTKQRNRVLSR